MGHKQLSLIKTNSKFQLSHGGELRKKRLGRGQRPLSTRDSLHAVLKINRHRLRPRSLRSRICFPLCLKITRRYARRFNVKIEQLSVQNDHIHMLVRTGRRSQFHHFFRVVAGQIAQIFQREGLLSASGAARVNRANTVTDTPEAAAVTAVTLAGVTDTPKGLQASKTPRSKEWGTGLWKFRPFSRVVRGRRAWKIVKNYIQLNELEVLGLRNYRPERLRGLSFKELEELWSRDLRPLEEPPKKLPRT